MCVLLNQTGWVVAPSFLKPSQSPLIMPANLLWCASCSNKCDVTVQTAGRCCWGSFNERVWQHVRILAHICGLIINVRVTDSLKDDRFSPVYFFGFVLDRFYSIFTEISVLCTVRDVWEVLKSRKEAVWPSDGAPVVWWARLAGPSASLWMISKAVFSYYSWLLFFFFTWTAMSRLRSPDHIHMRGECVCW